MSDGRPSLDFEVRVTGAPQAAGQLGQVADAAKAAQQPQINFLGSLGQAEKAGAAAAEETATSLRAAGRAARETHQVLIGLERGGVGGLITAFRGFVGLLRGPFAAAMGSIGVAVGPFVALWGAGMLEMRRRTEENKKAMEDMWEDGRQRAERYKQALQEIDEEAKKWSADQLAGLKAIDEQMAATDKFHQQAQSRANVVGTAGKEKALAELDLGKEQELAKAKTPQERAAIEARYGTQRTALESRSSSNAIDNDQLRAQQTVKEQNKVQRDVNDRLRSADLDVSNAKGEFDGVTSLAASSIEQFGAGDSHTLDLQARAKEAREKYQKLQEAAEKLHEDAGKTLEKSDQELDAARAVLEAIPIRRETQSMAERAQAIAASNSAHGQIAALEAEKERLLASRAKLASPGGESETPAPTDPFDLSNPRAFALSDSTAFSPSSLGKGAGADAENKAGQVTQIDERVAAIDREQQELIRNTKTLDQQVASTEKNTAAHAKSTDKMDQLCGHLDNLATAMQNLATSKGGTITRGDQAVTIEPGADRATVSSALADTFDPIDSTDPSMLKTLQRTVETQGQQIRNFVT